MYVIVKANPIEFCYLPHRLCKRAVTRRLSSRNTARVQGRSQQPSGEKCTKQKHCIHAQSTSAVPIHIAQIQPERKFIQCEGGCDAMIHIALIRIMLQRLTKVPK